MTTPDALRAWPTLTEGLEFTENMARSALGKTQTETRNALRDMVARGELTAVKGRRGLILYRQPQINQVLRRPWVNWHPPVDLDAA